MRNNIWKFFEDFVLNISKNPSSQFKEERNLERMFFLAHNFNNPQNNYKIIHIAGSKGKGSLAIFLANILNQLGYKTGVYTSPHIYNYSERIQIIGESFQETEKILEKEINRIQYFYASLDKRDTKNIPTFFELMTLLAFNTFKEAKCQYVVLETGLGGRLDATNIVTPMTSIITSIELEHTEILGKDLISITKEKAGIIKENKPLFVLDRENSDIFNTIEKIAKKKNAPLFLLENSLKKIERKKNDTFFITWLNGNQESITLQNPSSIQAINSSFALYVIRTLFPNSSREKQRKGIKQTLLLGRSQLIKDSPPIYFDGAHTINSIKSVIRETSFLWREKEKSLLFSCFDNKNYPEIIKLLAPHFSYIIITKIDNPLKESNPLKIYEIFRKYNKNVKVELSPEKCIKELKSKGNPIVVTGSFYLLGKIYPLLK